MATIPTVSGTASIPSFTRVPSFSRPSNPTSNAVVPTELQILGSAVASAQVLSGSGGEILTDTETVIVRDVAPGAEIAIPRFIQSDIGGRGSTRRIAVINEGPETLTVTAPPGVTLGGAPTSSILAGDTRIFTSVPTQVGVAVTEYAILLV